MQGEENLVESCSCSEEISRTIGYCQIIREGSAPRAMMGREMCLRMNDRTDIEASHRRGEGADPCDPL